MAKRYFDTDIWKKKWFRSLSPKYKSSWWYLISQCDHAGFFDPDIDIMSIFVGEELDETELMETFSSRIEYLDNGKWFIPKFIQFQYKVSHPDELNLSNRVHKSVYERIKKYSHLFSPIDEATKLHVSFIQAAKDKDKDKVIKNSSKKIKRKVFKIPTEQEVKEYCDKRENNINPAAFVAHYASKGWMVGKIKMVDWKAAVRTWENNDFTHKASTKVFVEPEHRKKKRGW